MRKVLAGITVALALAAPAFGAERLTQPVAEHAIGKFLRGEVRSGAISAYKIRTCLRYGRRWIHCRVSEYNPGEEFRYGIDARLRGRTIYVSSFAFGPLDQVSIKSHEGR